MAPRSRGFERLLLSTVNLSKSSSVCQSCRQSFAQRKYASVAAAQTAVEPPAASQLSPDQPQVDSAAQPRYLIKAGVLLSRAPLITADPHPFEHAYYLYQRRLNERTALPFTQFFYYKRGTPSFEQWRKNKTLRLGTATRDIGLYSAYKTDSWNDEVLLGDGTASPVKIVEQLVDEEGRGNEFAAESGLDRTAGLRRTTGADAENDQQSLERSLSRTLYLLVKETTQTRHENWIFPSGTLAAKEGIAEAAGRVLNETCGVNMNTWQVARHPVGYCRFEHKSLDSASDDKSIKSPSPSPPAHETAEMVGEKTFFIKTRIFAGQANLSQPNQPYEDFAWLTREEIEAKVHPGYWSRIKNMLAEQ